MSQFEIVTLSISLILGLSVAQILGSIASAIRSRHESPLHWLPLCWATAIFLFHIQYWLALLNLDDTVPSWTWDWYGPVLLSAVLLFFGGALVLPVREGELSKGLLRDFESHGKLALIPVSLYLAMWIPMNVRMGFAWVSPLNLVDVALVGLALLTLSTSRRGIREAATILYLVVCVWGVFFVWTPHGLG